MPSPIFFIDILRMFDSVFAGMIPFLEFKMKSSLALIDDGIQAAIAVETGEQLIDAALAKKGVKPKRYQFIAGLRVPSNATEDAEIDPEAKARLGRIELYRRDRGEIEAKLKEAGVEPLAILPKRAWETICEQANLYCFTPKGETVRANVSALITNIENDIESTAFKTVFRRRLVGFVLGAALSIYGWTQFSEWQLVGPALTSLFALVCAIRAAGLYLGDTNVEVDRRRQAHTTNVLQKITTASMRRRLQKMKRNKTLFSLLWPDRVDTLQGIAIAIALPDPPADVQQTLKSMLHTKLPLHLALVSDAIGISDQLITMMTQSIRDRGHERQEANRLQEERRRESIKNDPIVYMEHGSAIAIVAQYGNFPIEKQVVHQVMNSIHLV